MATRTVVQFLDDTDGSAAAETLRFGLDGAQYEIDLSAPNAARLRSTLEHYRACGRRLTRRATQPVRPAAPAPTGIDPMQRAAIRNWAARHGYTVPRRGRIPQQVFDAYNRPGCDHNSADSGA